MKAWIAFWNILAKDMRAYYLKPPNISWGLVFPLAWTAMFFIRSGSGTESIPRLLPGVMAVSVLFGTTSMLAVTVTFEKKGRSFERLLLAPISLELLMLAKTTGAIAFGVANAFVPVVMAAFLADLSAVNWINAHPSRFAHRRQFDVPGPVHRRIGKRGLRGPDVLELLSLPDDLPMWAILPHRAVTCLAPATVVRSASDVWSGRAARLAPSVQPHAPDAGLRPTGGVLRLAVRYQSAQH